VLLRVRVGADGLPEAVLIERGSGDRELDRAAQAAVRGWRFAPTLRDGVAVASEGLLPVEFSLDR
jgi:protein TonB